jgi:hypothetical protein
MAPEEFLLFIAHPHQATEAGVFLFEHRLQPAQGGPLGAYALAMFQGRDSIAAEPSV